MKIETKESISEFDGRYRWLSNFWLSPVAMRGYVFPTVENAYQAAKSLPQRQRYINCSPGAAKRMGQKVDIPANWDSDKLIVMRKLLNQKFQIGTFNALNLDHTGSKEIIEGNTWGDVFWGVCDGVGENNLGKMLMEIRDENRNK